MISEALLALESSLPFKLAYKRIKHIKHGHPSEHRLFIEKQQFDKHPNSDDVFIYTVNLMKCKDCGLHYLDEGLEFRK